MDKIRRETSHYPNGQIRGEIHFKGNNLTGTNRHWHENGQLSWETFFDENGLEHGTARQWDRDGKLLGEYSMEHGTGIRKSWNENGQLGYETAELSGKMHGRFQSWDDGEIIGTQYYISNKKVSKMKYDEACKNDPTLPLYDDDLSKKNVAEREQKQHEELILKLQNSPNQAEAREWLKGNSERNLGDLSSEESLDLVEAGYMSGAVKIVAVEIAESMTSDCLIVELPSEIKFREQVFQWSNDRAESAGWNPDIDWGQKELFIFLG